MASPFAYISNTNTTIDLVNMPTNAGPTIGNSLVGSTSLAITPTGVLYAGSANGVVLQVGGPPIPAGPTGRTQIADLDYENNGLWGFSNTTKELFFFDLGSASVTYSQVISVPSSITFTGVARQSSTGKTFLCGNNGLNSDFLMFVPNFGTSAVPLGAMPNGDAFSYFSDIDFDASGTLYAVSWFNRYFYSVSQTNGSTTLVSAGPHRDTVGMALNPVPEPASIAALGIGLFAVGRRRRARSKE